MTAPAGLTDAATITISIIAILISFVVFRINRTHPTSNDACGDNLTAVDLERISHSAVIITEGQRNVTR